MKTQKGRFFVNAIGFGMILVACLMVASPVISLSLIDYGHPISYKWAENKGEKEISLKNEDSEQAFEKFKQMLRFPIKANSTAVVLYGLLLGFLFMLLMFICYDPKRSEGDREIMSAQAFFAFVITAICIIVAPIVNAKHFAVADTLRGTIANKELAEAAVSKFWSDMIAGRILIAVIIFAIVMVVCGIVYWFLSKGIVISGGWLYSCWEKRMFKKLLFQHQDALLAGIVQENRAAVESGTLESAKALNPDRIIIQILSDGVVEIARFNYHLEWRPLPIMVLSKEVYQRISMDNFFRLLMADSKDVAFAELREKLAEVWERNYGESGKQACSSFTATLVASVRKELADKIAEAQKGCLTVSKDLAAKLLQGVVDKSLRQFRTDLGKLGSEEIGLLVKDFKSNLLQETRARLSSFRRRLEDLDVEEGGFVVPNGTRLFAKRGNTSVFVIEQFPQIRNIRASRSISGNRRKEMFAVAFPYVVFVIVMRDNVYGGMHVFYRSKPLESMDDPVFRTNLPNISSDGDVCDRFGGHRKDGLVARVEEVISHFWNSMFNSDRDDGYELYQQRERLLADFETWEAQSKKNPLFFLQVELCHPTRLRQVLRRILESASTNPADLESEITAELEQAFSITEDELRESLIRLFGQIEVKQRYPRQISEAVARRQDEITAVFADLVAQSFNQICGNGNLDNSFSERLEAAFQKVLAEDFSGLANEVLIRRRVTTETLIRRARGEE